MTHTIVGLGNPGKEYEGSRHNIGRTTVEAFAKKYCFSEWKEGKDKNALIAKGELDGVKVVLALPQTFMNKSGKAVGKMVKSAKATERLVVLYDDMDIPLGKVKISFGRGSGGHKGVDSIIRALGTKKFTRIRIGISPATPSGKLKKPLGDEKVVRFLMERFKASEEEKLRQIKKRVFDALGMIVGKGRAEAMNVFNQ